MSHHSDSHGAASENTGHTPLKPLDYRINKVAAVILAVLGMFIIYFAILDSLKGSSTDIGEIQGWVEEKTGFGTPELGGPKDVLPSTPSTPAKPSTGVKKPVSKTLSGKDIWKYDASASQFPQGYWISGDNPYRVVYTTTSGVKKILNSEIFARREIIQFPNDRNWRIPLEFHPGSDGAAVTITVHPPD